MSRERGGVVVSFILLLVVLSIVTGVVFFTFGRVVPPNYIGLRQNFYGVPGVLTKGYEPVGLKPGLHWKLPFFSTVLLLPRDFQFINFHDIKGDGDLSLSALDVPTTDGSKVKTDVSLVLRLFDRPGETRIPKANEAESKETIEVPTTVLAAVKHGGPKNLVLSYTESKETQLRRIAQVAENELRKSLSELSTTDYYDPALRESAALRANEHINSKVNDKGVEVWGALIRRYVYAEKKIDDQIFEKNLQEQTERLNISSGRYEAAKAKTEEAAAFGDAKIQDLIVKGQSQVKLLRSQGELYESKKKAEGDLLVARSKANVDEQRAKVLSSSRGAQIYVARELAPLVATLSGGIVTGIDPFDINAWVKRFIAEERQ